VLPYDVVARRDLRELFAQRDAVLWVDLERNPRRNGPLADSAKALPLTLTLKTDISSTKGSDSNSCSSQTEIELVPGALRLAPFAFSALSHASSKV
jgi:hypothetical protein